MSTDRRPRYCFLAKSQIGYGFNLHGEEPRNNENVTELTTFYHVIKSVDEKSPACLGGLKQDDRLIGVNGFYVDTKPHNEVVRLIRSGGSSTWLLVVDRETDEYFFKVAKRKPNFSDAVYGQEDKRGQPVDRDAVPMEEEREFRNGNVAQSDEDTDGHESQKSESAEMESPRMQPVPASRSRNEESDEEEDEDEETHKREEMQEHRSQEEEEAVNALVDAVNQHDISREDQQQSHQSSNRVSAQQSDDNESESESAKQRGSYFHFQKEENDKEERADEPPQPSKPASEAPESEGGDKMMFLNMQSAREAARGKRNAAKTAGNWATKYEDFKRL